MEIRGVGTIFQWVSDLDASTAWYRDFLGRNPVPYALPMFPLGESTFLALAPGAPGTGRGGTGVYFEVDDTDEAYAELKARGYQFNEEPFDTPGGRVVTLNDPDGNIFGMQKRGAGAPGR